jgi:hypothetical protein
MVLDAGDGDQDSQQQAHDVNGDVPLRPLIFFSAS